jgi:hypothetical protein
VLKVDGAEVDRRAPTKLCSEGQEGSDGDGGSRGEKGRCAIALAFHARVNHTLVQSLNHPVVASRLVFIGRVFLTWGGRSTSIVSYWCWFW